MAVMVSLRVHRSVLFLLCLICGAAFHFRCSVVKDHACKRLNIFRETKRWMELSGPTLKESDDSEGDNSIITTDNISQLKSSAKNLHVILSGAPAAGKGTQCEFIQKQFDLVHISTGELLRTAMRDNTDLGNKVRIYMDTGKLVPDNIIISVVCARLSQADCRERGWLLDGFPRTEAQAEALYKDGHVADCFVLLDVSQAILLDRITGRRTDPLTGRVYHLTHNPPNDPEVVQRLVQRSDDTPEKLVGRYADYQRHTGAIRSFYKDRTIVVDGGDNKEVISKRLGDLLEGIKKEKMDIFDSPVKL